MLPSNLSRRVLIDAPPLVLNLMMPGAGGAAAAGLFEIARKLSTVPLIVRQSFQYVLAPLSSAQAHADRAQVARSIISPAASRPRWSCRWAACSSSPAVDILSVYQPRAAAALPLLDILVAARAVEAIVGPAATIVEMIGHRALPLLNSLIAIAVWIALAWWLVPGLGAHGMAWAIAIATVASTYAATLELRISDGLQPFDRKLFQGLGLALTGVALMAVAEYLMPGPARFAVNISLWAATSWLTLRYGLTLGDREALGGLSRRLRLV